MLAHNVFLQTAYNCGIIAGIVYLAYCIFCVIYGSFRYVKKDNLSLYAVIGMSAYAVCGMFESMEAYYFPLLFIALIGLLPLVCTSREQSSQDEEDTSALLIEQTQAKRRMQKLLSIIILATICIGFLYLVFIASSNPNKYILEEMLK